MSHPTASRRPRPRPPLYPGILLLFVLLLGGCGTVQEADPPVQGIVDSVFPIDEEIRRFMATLDSVPTALRHGAPDREALVTRFIRAVETRDPLELPRLLLQRDEFIALYYPSSQYTTRPYELAPALLWFRMENTSSRGINRLLERMGGRALGYAGMTCPDQPRAEGRNRIWEGCTVRTGESGGPGGDRQLFGDILERDGVWKFLSYANEF